MRDFPAELLYVLMLVALVLIQYLKRRFGPKPPPEPAWDERLEEISEAPAGAPAAPATSASVAGQFRRNAARETSRRRRFSRTSLMGDRREVQNAVVVATILGPCRAFEPHDIRE